MKKLNSKKLLIFLVFSLVVLFFVFDLKKYFDLDYVKSQKESLEAYYIAHKAFATFIYFAIYVCVTALSLPGATVLTLIGGAIFGVFQGTILVSFASTTGATLAFLSARFLMRDSIQNQFGDKLETINKGIKEEGAFYLLTLRLIPLVPFFVINLVMGLTKIPTRTFFLVSQIGMLPGTAIYVNAGTQLAKIESLRGIMSAQLLFSFALLGVFPLIAKKIIQSLKKG
jgi:uncharacterized membrane protein YdjX (TVP38/TMEM64 family)